MVRCTMYGVWCNNVAMYLLDTKVIYLLINLFLHVFRVGMLNLLRCYVYVIYSNVRNVKHKTTRRRRKRFGQFLKLTSSYAMCDDAAK